MFVTKHIIAAYERQKNSIEYNSPDL